MAEISFTPLYDCGWTDEYDEALLQPLRRVISRIDLVLISHPDIYHMGALPYAMGTLGLKVPIYGTLPVYRMGQIAMYDAYQGVTRTHPSFSLFSLDDIDLVFEHFKQLKYSEKLSIDAASGDANHKLVITPYNAGHLIGGSLWKISASQETDDIVYAVDYNHRTEHILSKSTLDSINRPTLLIADSMNLLTEQPKLKDRDSKIMEEILHTIRKGGNVLIPCDTAGRVLELMRVLDQYWIQSKLRDPIALLHDMSYYVSKAAQAMLEWCNERITKNFDIGRTNPFQFTNVHLLHSLEDLKKLKSPKVVLATSETLECGYAKELFISWASDPRNKIIFTTRVPETTLAHRVYEAAINFPVSAPERTFALQISRNVPLQGLELLTYEAKEKRRAQAEAEKKAQEAEESAMENMILGIEGYEDESDDSEPEDSGKTTKPMMMNHSNDKQLRGSFKVGFGQFATSKYPMLLHVEEPVEFDEYGEFIDVEHYMDQKHLNGRRKATDGMLKSFDSSSGKSSATPMDLDRPSSVENGNDEEDEDEAFQNIPTKIISEEITVEVKCDIVHVNFDGLADGRAIKNCISNIKPRKLILIHGTLATTEALQSFVEKSLGSASVFSPSALECIDIESDTNIYRLKLQESLYRAMRFQKVGQHEVAYVYGQVNFPSESSVPILEPMERSKAARVSSTTDQSGELRLSEGHVKLDILKQLLARAGFKSQFRGGMLVCQDGVVLKRTKRNGVVVEGTLSEAYYQIRSLLYDQFTLV